LFPLSGLWRRINGSGQVSHSKRSGLDLHLMGRILVPRVPFSGEPLHLPWNRPSVYQNRFPFFFFFWYKLNHCKLEYFIGKEVEKGREAEEKKRGSWERDRGVDF
jgi:hypothetical protein